jgi:integrase
VFLRVLSPQLRYQSAQECWARYCAAAGVDATLHQLRYTHATEFVNAGLMQNQLDSAISDERTKLPPGLTITSAAS